MAKRALSTLKSFFLTGLYPTQNQFHDMLDSFVHKDDGIGMNQISGLSEALNGKYSQDSAGELELRVETIESRISEQQSQINELSTVRQRAYTLDFGTDSELAQDSNLLGAITIDRILTQNVAVLYLSYGSVIRQQIPIGGTVSLSIPDETILIWEIVRTTDSELACVGVRYNINTQEEE